MVGLIICLVILPYLYGSIFLGKEKNAFFLCFAIGVIIEFAIWSVVSLPIVLLGKSVSLAVFLFSACNIPIAGYGIYKLIVWIQAKSYGDYRLKRINIYFNKISFFIMMGIILFQAGRATFFECGYGDDRVYVAMVNDMVETDRFYPYVDESGAVWQDTAMVPKKYLLSSWYTFEAMLARISGIKPLMLVYTILPGYIIILMYVIWWWIADVFFHHCLYEKIGFIIALALCLEFHSEDLSSYILRWPTYGKNITASLVVPMLLLLWITNRKNKSLKQEVGICMLMLVGCAASTMGLMIMPMEMTLLTGIEIWKQRHLTWREILQWLIFLFPVLLYVILFIS